MSADIVKIRDYQIGPANYGVRHEDPAVVIILPVVRIERNPEEVFQVISEGLRRRRRLPSLLTLKQKMEALRALQAAERGD